jgi:esterase/lipase superfamily enzyme
MPRVYFSTNRNFLGNSSPWFADISTPAGDLRFGYTDIDETNDYNVTAVTILPDNKSEGSDAVFGRLQQIMKDQERDTLIYIHGYNTTFAGALSDAARLVDCLKTASDNEYEPNVIAYSWPSQGKLLDYTTDRHDAQASALGLARALLKYYNFLLPQLQALRNRSQQDQICKRQVHLLCHSMGNYLFRYALQSLLSINNQQPIKLFTETLLIAADEDNDAFDFNYKLLPLSQMARRITVYFNKDDKALAASKDLKHNMTRLGASGPLHTSDLPPVIKPVDVTQAVHGFVEHGYFNDPACGRVHADMVETLLGTPSETIADRTYNAQAGKYVLQAVAG